MPLWRLAAILLTSAELAYTLKLKPQAKETNPC